MQHRKTHQLRAKLQNRRNAVITGIATLAVAGTATLAVALPQDSTTAEAAAPQTVAVTTAATPSPDPQAA
ncbi:hypothetical protein, partial [Kitasatospora paracochleata]